MRRSLATFGSSAMAAGFAVQAMAAELSCAVPPEVQVYVAATYGGALSTSVFLGDFTGDGEPDAVAFIYYPFAAGNSFGLDVSLFEARGGALVHTRMVEGVYGMEPRNVTISYGRIEATTTTMNLGDPRCCPTRETKHEFKP